MKKNSSTLSLSVIFSKERPKWNLANFFLQFRYEIRNLHSRNTLEKKFYIKSIQKLKIQNIVFFGYKVYSQMIKIFHFLFRMPKFVLSD